MSKLTVNLPESLRRRAETLASTDGVSLDQFIALAVAEKLSAMESVQALRREAASAKREDFDRVLAAVPAREPIETDRLPE